MLDHVSRTPVADRRLRRYLLHYVEIIRQPLLGLPIAWHHWYVVGAITLVGCAAALVCMRNYRSRVAYWV